MDVAAGSHDLARSDLDSEKATSDMFVVNQKVTLHSVLATSSHKYRSIICIRFFLHQARHVVLLTVCILAV